MPPLGLYIFTLLYVNIDQIPLIRGMFVGQMRSNPHLLQVGQYIDRCIREGPGDKVSSTVIRLTDVYIHTLP